MTFNKEKIVLGVIKGAALLTLLLLVWIIGYIIFKGAGHVSLAFLSSDQRHMAHGILPMIVSTLYLVFLGIMIATPIGVFAAIYLSEYAKQGRLVKAIRFATESLAAIPSIIYGLFGGLFFTQILGLGISLLSGILTVSIMVLPTVIRATEEALMAVPMSYREGSFALGASKFRTIFKVIVPSALPSISSAIVLSMGRIVGESAAVLFTAGMVPRMPRGILDPGRTLSVHMYLLASEGISFDEAFATAFVLVVIILGLNLLANQMAKWMNRKREA